MVYVTKIYVTEVYKVLIHFGRVDKRDLYSAVCRTVLKTFGDGDFLFYKMG